jgi:hypothetical protein
MSKFILQRKEEYIHKEGARAVDTPSVVIDAFKEEILKVFAEDPNAGFTYNMTGNTMVLGFSYEPNEVQIVVVKNFVREIYRRT